MAEYAPDIEQQTDTEHFESIKRLLKAPESADALDIPVST